MRRREPPKHEQEHWIAQSAFATVALLVLTDFAVLTRVGPV